MRCSADARWCVVRWTMRVVVIVHGVVIRVALISLRVRRSARS